MNSDILLVRLMAISEEKPKRLLCSISKITELR